MGSPEHEEGRFDREGPAHKVTLTEGYWLGETPTTQSQWQTVTRKKPSHFKGDLNPVDSVSWNDCNKMLNVLNKKIPELNAHLPSEAQWEYACRAGTSSAYNDGSHCTKPTEKDLALDQLGWFCQNSKGKTQRVKEQLPNAWGLYDMHGNIWEWCRDGCKNYQNTPVIDPVGSLNDTFPALRGGSWILNARHARSASRHADHRGDRYRIIGFRLAASQPANQKPRLKAVK